jgi:hypothetical protein
MRLTVGTSGAPSANYDHSEKQALPNNFSQHKCHAGGQEVLWKGHEKSKKNLLILTIYELLQLTAVSTGDLSEFCHILIPRKVGC